MSPTQIDRRTLLAGGIAAAAVAAQPALSRTVSSPTVTCLAGRFAGRKENGIHTFLGIRYGHAARFRAPVAVARSKEIIQANTYGPSC